MAEAGTLRQSWRPVARALTVLAALALGACSTIVPRSAPPPRAAPTQAPPPVATAPEPSQPGLPQDVERNRVAVLVPLTGPNAAVGRSIANAANLAILDTGGAHVRITVYDTGGGAAAAAQKALAEGNRLFLGPLLSEDVAQVAAIARQAGVPVVSFSNDVSVAGDGVFVMGFTPTQSIDRVIAYAKSRGLSRIAGLIPAGVYGRRAGTALLAAANDNDATIVSMQSFDRTPASLSAAVAKLGPRASYDAVLIADNGRIALQAAPLIRKAAGVEPRLLGTELWATDPALAAAPAMTGAWYASVPDAMYAQLAAKYRQRFGRPPYRLASLGYDAVLLTVRIAADWRQGAAFPMRELTDKGGFAGVDGAFRFDRNGIADRALAVTQVGPHGGTVVSPAPVGFGGN